MIDVNQQISAVKRRVGNRTLEAGEAHVATITQTYNATVEDVWDACTNPERIPRWFLPVSGELRVGGHYQLEGNAGGTIERCDPPKSFTATWEYDGAVSWIELRLTPAPDGVGVGADAGSDVNSTTRFALDHISRVDDPTWAEFGPGAVGVGWDMALVGFALHLGGGSAVDDEAFKKSVMAWIGSDQGRRFVSLSSRRWREANVLAGADEAGARAAEAKTTAAYGGATDKD